MKYINQNEYKQINEKIGGHRNNIVVTYKDKKYILKKNIILNKNMDDSPLTRFRQTALSEYIACEVIQLFYDNVQNVLLSKDNTNEYCVLCEMFCEPNEMILWNRDSSKPDFEDINIASNNTYIRDTLQEKYRIPDMYNKWLIITVLDFLVGNRDRHLGNLGILLKNNKPAIISLIFDCGSSLACYISVSDNLINSNFYTCNFVDGFDNIQALYQNFNGIRINNKTILNNKLPNDFYDTVEKIVKPNMYDSINAIFDDIIANIKLKQFQIDKLELSRAAVFHNYVTLQKSIGNE